MNTKSRDLSLLAKIKEKEENDLTARLLYR